MLDEKKVSFPISKEYLGKSATVAEVEVDSIAGSDVENLDDNPKDDFQKEIFELRQKVNKLNQSFLL